MSDPNEMAKLAAIVTALEEIRAAQEAILADAARRTQEVADIKLRLDKVEAEVGRR